MHFLTLTAVQVPEMEEELEQNKYREHDPMDTAFARLVEDALEEKMEPYNVNTRDERYLFFQDETDSVRREYQGGTDCLRLPQGSIVPVCGKPYYGRFVIREGKVLERDSSGRFRQTRRAKKIQGLPRYPFRKLYKDLRQFAEKWKGVDWNEEHQAFGFSYNYQGQWDWYSIGERWAFLLLVRDTCSEYISGEWGLGAASGPQPPKGYKWASAARMKDIQWQALEQYYCDEVKAWYEQLRRFFQTGERPAGFEGHRVPESIDLWGERIFSKEEPWELFLEKNMPFADRRFPIMTCPFLDEDGSWENELYGGVGDPPDEMKQALDRFLDSLNPEDVLVVVDCHI